jgi:hypothetical protein
MNKQLLSQLSNERSNPSVTIAFNTHKTHPDTQKDIITLKNLVKEAINRLNIEYANIDTTSIQGLLEEVSHSIDFNYNLKSLHIFVSSKLAEIVRSPESIPSDGVAISDRFEVDSLLSYLDHVKSYLVMVLSQSGVSLYEAANNHLIYEIKDEGFPMEENPYYLKTMEDRSESALELRMVTNFMNEVDNNLIKVYNKTNVPCVVISTESNYSILLKTAKRPAIYLGHSAINYNDLSSKTIGDQAWEIARWS